MIRDVGLQKPPPCLDDQPLLDEVFQSIQYTHILKKQKFEANVEIPDDEIVNEELTLFEVSYTIICQPYTHQRLSKRSAHNAAPAWFAPAIQQALAPAIQQALAPAIQQALEPLVREIRELRSDIAVVYNRSGSLPDHPIMPRPRPQELGHAPLPPDFPKTTRDLRDLNGPLCSACLRYYGLEEQGNTPEKKKRLAYYLGAQLA